MRSGLCAATACPLGEGQRSIYSSQFLDTKPSVIDISLAHSLFNVIVCQAELTIRNTESNGLSSVISNGWHLQNVHLLADLVKNSHVCVVLHSRIEGVLFSVQVKLIYI